MGKESHRRHRSRVEPYTESNSMERKNDGAGNRVKADCMAQSPRCHGAANNVHMTNGIKRGTTGGTNGHGTSRAVTAPTERPKFSDLPLHPSHPPGSAWGLYGDDDELGTLNLLTPDVVRAAAASEIRLGETVPLNLPLTEPLLPMNPRRKPCTHTIIAKGYANDDELQMNTQGSSHWDGLRHYPYQEQSQDGESGKETPSARFYNGVTQQDISGPGRNTRLGIQAPAQRGIAGRGVLLDWQSWAEAQGIEYAPFATHAIPVSQLEAVAAAQNLAFRVGDILLVRTGWTEAYARLGSNEAGGEEEAKRKLAARPVRAFIGVESSRETLAWHWDHGFAAVAGDTNAYEAWPPAPRDYHGLSCHEVFLSGWGMPIGELWDLEALARRCRELGRWSFFLTSCPLNLPAGVASPPNAMAIF